MKLRKRWITLALSLALPATAIAAAPAGKYSGKLTGVTGSKITFKVKPGGKTLVNFRAHAPSGSLTCFGSPRSLAIFLPKAKIKGKSFSATRSDHTGEIDKLTGKVSGKHASGTVEVEFFGSGGTLVCGSGKLKWTARLGQAADPSGDA